MIRKQKKSLTFRMLFAPLVIAGSVGIASQLQAAGMFDGSEEFRLRGARHEQQILAGQYAAKKNHFISFLADASQTGELLLFPIHEQMVIKTALDVIDISTLLDLISPTNGQSMVQRLQAIIDYRISTRSMIGHTAPRQH